MSHNLLITRFLLFYTHTSRARTHRKRSILLFNIHTSRKEENSDRIHVFTPIPNYRRNGRKNPIKFEWVKYIGITFVPSVQLLPVQVINK